MKTRTAAAAFLGAFCCSIWAGAAQKHPSLVFDDIKNTPGWNHRSVDPWKTWEEASIQDANGYLGTDFASNPAQPNETSDRALVAAILAFAYQLKGDAQYGNAVRSALINLRKGVSGAEPFRKALALCDYSLTYDWGQPGLSVSDDATARAELAAYAQEVYGELRDDVSPAYVTFADYHGRAYLCLGLAGLALGDDPAAEEWLRVGTEYLFVNDPIHQHPGTRPLVWYQWDDTGRDFDGAYRGYYIQELIWLVQAYSHAKGQNLFNIYPIAHDHLIADVWDTLPNRYNSDFVTDGNMAWIHHAGIINLLTAEEQAVVLNHYEKASSSKLLPYSSHPEGWLDNALLYSVWDDYSAVPRHEAATTSRFRANAVVQTFRGSWAEDADWMAFTTWNKDCSSNRPLGHHDQLAFEFFSRGDLLLADAGEDKHVLDRMYGALEVHHNTVAIEDPRQSFGVSDWSGNSARGIYKGAVHDYSGGNLVTPAPVQNVVAMPWMELVHASAEIQQVVGQSWDTSHTLSSPIHYDRIVAFPAKEFFAVIDRLEGTEPWVYRNTLRPSSLNIEPTVDENNIGHVNGTLNIGSAAYDWGSKAYKIEQATGLTTNGFGWSTKNLSQRDVELQVFSVPASEVLVTKHVGRVAGYDIANEVYVPVVGLRAAAAHSLYRVTVLLSRYASEQARTPEQVAVSGTGSAVRVISAGSTDYLYAGTGESSFGQLATDARVLHVRLGAQPVSFTWVGGSGVDWSGAPLAKATSSLDSASWRQDGTMTWLVTKSPATNDMRLYRMDPSASYAVRVDGQPLTGWRMENGNVEMVLPVAMGEHLFEISSSGSFPDAGPTLLDSGAGGAGGSAGAGGSGGHGGSSAAGAAGAADAGLGAEASPTGSESGGCGCRLRSPLSGSLAGFITAIIVWAAARRRRAQDANACRGSRGKMSWNPRRLSSRSSLISGCSSICTPRALLRVRTLPVCQVWPSDCEAPSDDADKPAV
jgi:hypothetical protein